MSFPCEYCAKLALKCLVDGKEFSGHLFPAAAAFANATLTPCPRAVRQVRIFVGGYWISFRERSARINMQRKEMKEHSWVIQIEHRAAMSHDL